MIKRIDSPVVKKKERELVEIQEVEFLEIQDNPFLDEIYSSKPKLPKNIEKSLKETLDQIDREYQKDLNRSFAEELATKEDPTETILEKYARQQKKQEAINRYQRMLQDNLPRLPNKTRSDFFKKKG